MPAACCLAATGLVKSGAAILAERKAPAASLIAAIELVNSWVIVFIEKNQHPDLKITEFACIYCT